MTIQIATGGTATSIPKISSKEAAERAITPSWSRQPAETTTTTSADLEASQSRMRSFERGTKQSSHPLTMTTSSSSVTVGGTTFEIGPNKRPDIQHDNGFLQNRADPDDPVPQPTREPTEAEVDYYNSERRRAGIGGFIAGIPGAGFFDSRADLDHALPAYQHFLNGEGADRTFNYEAFLKDDASGQTVRDSALSDVRTAGDQLYADLDDQVGTEPGSQITFQMRSDAFTVGGSSRFPYPDTEDWQKAIGGHSAWTSSEVTVTRQEDGSLMAVADVTIHAEDRYNFNPGQADIATGAPDSERGVLEETGLAQQYTQTGEAEFQTAWIIGAPATTVDARGNGSGR